MADSGPVDEVSTGVLGAGTFLAPHYEIVALIGRGATSTVYRGLSKQLSLPVAVKVFDPSLLVDSASVERFFREARVIAALDHLNLVKLIHYGRDSVVGPYLVLELVEGTSLKQIIQREPKIDAVRAVNFFRQICCGIEEVHASGLLHRDLKPENVLITGDESQCEALKIIDFGLACWSDPTAEKEQKLTRTGAIIGTAAYMSPEQCRAHKTDVRSDIYSMGCIFYEVLCGVPPFVEETTMAVLDKHVRSAIDEIPSKVPIPRDLENIVRKMLQKNPSDRYQSVKAIQSALDSIDFDWLTSKKKKSVDLSVVLMAGGLLTIVLVFGVMYGLQNKNTSSPVWRISTRLKSDEELGGKTPAQKIQYLNDWLRDANNKHKPLELASAHSQLAENYAHLSDGARSNAQDQISWQLARSVCKNELTKGESASVSDFVDAVLLVAKIANRTQNQTRAFCELRALMNSNLAKKTGPEISRTQLEFGLICKHTGHYVEASEALRAALRGLGEERRFSPEYLSCQIQLSNCLWRTKDFAGARAALNQVVSAVERTDRFDPMTILFVAEQFCEQNEPLRAQAMLDSVKERVLSGTDDFQLAQFHLVQANLEAAARPGQPLEVVYEKALKYSIAGRGKFLTLMANLAGQVSTGKVSVDPDKFLPMLFRIAESRRSRIATTELLNGISSFCSQLYQRGDKRAPTFERLLLQNLLQCKPQDLALSYGGVVELSNALYNNGNKEAAYNLLVSLRNRLLACPSTAKVDAVYILTLQGVVLLRSDRRFDQAEKELLLIRDILDENRQWFYVQYCVLMSAVLRETGRGNEAPTWLQRAELVAVRPGLDVTARNDLMLNRASLLLDERRLAAAKNLVEQFLLREDVPDVCVAVDRLFLAEICKSDAKAESPLSQYDRYFEVCKRAGFVPAPNAVKCYVALCRLDDKTGTRISRLKSHFPGLFGGTKVK